MQENRSFDSYFGTLRGVRGYGDPRAALITSTEVVSSSSGTIGFANVPGNSVFYQPNPKYTTLANVANTGPNPLTPFRPNFPTNFGYQWIGDLSHNWSDAHYAWNQGNNDGWIGAKGTETMVHYNRTDMPFQYALADAFTICDNYHCAIMGPTDPNRYYMWTGWVGQNGLTAGAQNETVSNVWNAAVAGTFTLGSGGDGALPGGPCVNNSDEGGAQSWITYPELLTQAGITWKFYQDMGGSNLASTGWGYTSNGYIGNYGDTSCLWFKQYQAANTAGHASPQNFANVAQQTIYNSACTGTNISASGYNVSGLFAQLQSDVLNGTLPQVSWVVAPYLFSEHPDAPPNWGAWYIENVLAALVANPAVWAGTVFIINFDENDGFFDHVVAPTAPQSGKNGLSTVSTVNEIYPGVSGSTSYPGPNPYGMGARVPCLVISPWSKGGYVCSQVFDHTSINQFIAKRFGVTAPHLTPWRGTVSGDLTSALNFAVNNATSAHLPSTSGFFAGVTGTQAQNYTISAVTATQVAANHSFTAFSFTGEYPTTASVPVQETGVRLARPLPYQLQADAGVGASALTITFGNTGTAGAWFQVRNGVKVTARSNGIATAATVVAHTNYGLGTSGNTGGTGPWGYTVDPTTQTLTDMFTPATASYDLSVTGTNGFYRRFAGTLGAGNANLDVQCVYNLATGGVSLTVTNVGSATTTVQANEGYSGAQSQATLAPEASTTFSWPLTNSYSWYDVVLTTSTDTSFVRHYAGHVETGQDSASDPYLGGVVANFPSNVLTILGTE